MVPNKYSFKNVSLILVKYLLLLLVWRYEIKEFDSIFQSTTFHNDAEERNLGQQKRLMDNWTSFSRNPLKWRE